ncbi:MAG: hypothetical protein ABFS37_07375 [Acidobacteriota bacterium]
MQEANLISVCLVAFTSVFGLLIFLAVVMQMITRLFPVRIAQMDSAVVAAIATVVAGIVPGARVTRIEEE